MTVTIDARDSEGTRPVIGHRRLAKLSGHGSALGAVSIGETTVRSTCLAYK